MRQPASTAIALVLLFAVAADSGDPAAWNERGIRSYKAGDYSVAIHCFHRALDEKPGDGTILFNLASCHARLALDLIEESAVSSGGAEAIASAEQAVGLQAGHAYFHRVLGYVHQQNGRYDDAFRAFAAADSIEPDAPETLALLGDAVYKLDDLSAAIGYWEKSLRLDPGQDDLRERMGRAERERDLETGFRSIRRNHFIVTYDPSIPTGYREANRLVGILNDSRREVGAVIGHWTEKPVPVVVYSKDRFRALMGEREWTRGLYDGKIRLPLSDDERSRSSLRALATHEYVHAAIYELTGDRCPAWLNEGLAQVLAGEWSAGADRTAREMIATSGIVPLSALEASFLNLPEEEVEDAYVQSFIVVSYLLDEYTRSHLRRLLGALERGASPGDAVRSIYHRDCDEVLERAMDHYGARRAG